MTTDYVVRVYLGIMGYREKYHQIMKRGFDGQRSQARIQPDALLYFEDARSAERAQVELLGMGYPVAKYLMRRSYPETCQGRYNPRHCTTEPVCGWSNVEDGDLIHSMDQQRGPCLRNVYVTQPEQLRTKAGKTEVGSTEAKPRTKDGKSAKKNQRADGSGNEGSGATADRAGADGSARAADRSRADGSARTSAGEAQISMADEMELD